MADDLFARRYAQASAHDARLDGHFVTGLTMSEIFCRPGCATRTPRPSQVRFFPTAAAAHAAGLTPCPRCRPDATCAPPASAGADTVGTRAMRLIDDGEVDRTGVVGLARKLGVTPRHVLRAVEEVAGCGPLDVARAARAHRARLLLVSTTIPMERVAAAAGFASLRQFHGTMRQLYRATPVALRFGGRRRSPATAEPGPLVVWCTLPVRHPFDAASMFAFLSARAVPEMEQGTDHWFARTVRLPVGTGHVRVDSDARGGLLAKLTVSDPRDFAPLWARVRRLLDLDADPLLIDRVLGRDPVLAPLVAARPGLRVPGAVDGAEMLIRGLVERLLPTGTARTMLGGLVSALGDASPWGLVFPTPRQIAEHGRSVLRGPTELIDAVMAIAEALGGGELAVHPGVARRQLAPLWQRVPHVEPWLADYLTMRVVHDPDIVGAADPAVRQGVASLGLAAGEADLADRALLWSPWRSYAAAHLRLQTRR